MKTYSTNMNLGALLALLVFFAFGSTSYAQTPNTFDGFYCPGPGELNDEYGELLRKEGREFGATTGRPRRCGWLDLVALRYAVRLNGMNEIALTKLDVLDHVDQIKVCIAYELDGQRVEEFPTKLSELERVVPIYETLQGWKGESTRNIDTFDKLPTAAQAYVEWVEEKLGVPFTIVSTGPGREETLQRTT